jgi:hypothetical protein
MSSFATIDNRAAHALRRISGAKRFWSARNIRFRFCGAQARRSGRANKAADEAAALQKRFAPPGSKANRTAPTFTHTPFNRKMNETLEEIRENLEGLGYGE